MVKKLWPVGGNRVVGNPNNKYAGYFGLSRNNGARWHGGVDIAANAGDQVFAFKTGVVIRAGWQNAINHNEGFGQRIVMEHKETINGQEKVTYSVYAHLKDINVEIGQSIEEGQEIGRVGRTGNVMRSQDTHLHFEIRKDVYPGNSRDNLNPSDQFGTWDKIKTFF